MCGINGIFAYHYAANPIDRAALIRTRDHMATRGPDGKGEWIANDDRIGFGHRRLSIVDLSDAGAQPMISAEGKLIVTFNGEIYNYHELRKKLEARGRVFRSHSDTEVLLHLYAEKGAEMVHDLRGMFAFAIWDTECRALFLARDPYGIKPLYYSDDGWTFRFASQVKALLRDSAISREPEPAGQAGFYLWGSVPEPFTTFQSIRALPAGTTLNVNRTGAHEPKRFHSIAQIYREAEARRPALSEMDDREKLRAALLDSVRHHLAADVPVGAFLSAGIDSGALVGLMRDVDNRNIQTVTLAFEEFRGKAEDEAPLAAEVARLYGTQHSTRVISEAEFKSDLPRILDAMDQPSVDGINTWFVSKAAHELGLKVAISGLGGDEQFGGYPSFRDVPRWHRAAYLPSRIPFAGRLLRAATVVGGRFVPGLSPKAAGIVEWGGTYAGAYLLRRAVFMPWELSNVMAPELAKAGLERLRLLELLNRQLQPGPRSHFAVVATLEASVYMRNQLLRDTDWASMAHGLEVRVPLVDHKLLSEIAPHLLAGCYRRGKEVLAEAPKTQLPRSVTSRPKTGFSTPIGTWLQGQLCKDYEHLATLTAPGCRSARRWAHIVAGQTVATPPPKETIVG